MRWLAGLARDERYRSLRGRLRNIAHLLTGNMANAVIALVAIALTARGLGPAAYGILAIAFAYARAVERLVTFQSWQPIIRYGAALDTPEQAEDLKSLLKFGLLLDGAGALLAAAVGAVLVVAGKPLFGWSDDVVQTLLICCAMLPFNINGTPTAIVRIFGRYRLAAWGPVAASILRLAGCALALLAGAGLATYAAIWAASQAVAYMIFLGLALGVLRSRGITGLLRASARGVPARFQGIWRFAWLSNISLTVRSSADQFDILLVGALAGTEAAGFYSIAKRAGRLAEQVSTQAQAVLFPDVARLWASGQFAEMRRAIFQLDIMLLFFGLGATLFFMLAAEPIIRLAAGADFAPAATLLVVQMLAVTLSMSGAGARSGLLAMGKEDLVLRAVLTGTAAFHITAFAMIPMIGPMGANIAHIVLGLLASGLMIFWCRRGLRGQGA
jgi:O-antigen/teichoic acid export membrane protein